MANLFLTGVGVPTGVIGEITDYYRDTITNLIYYYAPTGWEVVPSLVPTPDGVGTHWFYGNGTPSNGIGGVNDYYRDDVSGSVYRKNSSNLWEAKGSLDFIGVYGVQWGEGTGAPANIPSLNNLPAGSFYLDVATSDIYYKDNTLTWSLKGQLGGGGGGGGGVTVVDNLTTQSTADALSANQGYLLSQDIANKADLASPAFTGAPTAPTAAANTNSTQVATTAYADAAANSAKTYADGLVVGLLDDRGNYNPTVTSNYPTAANNGSGGDGAVLKGDLWAISADGTIGGIAVTVGDTVRALVDTPAQTASNWAIIQNMGNTPVVQSYADNALPLASSVAINTEIFNTTYQVKMRSDGTSWEWLGAGRSTWANKPSVAPSGQVICITDVGENGSLWRGDGTNWVRLHSIRYYDLTAAVSVTGTTSETALATISIPAGLIGAKGKVLIYPLFSATNNANNKTIRVRLGGATGYSLQTSGYAQLSSIVIFRNFNSESVQKIASSTTTGLGGTSGAVTSLFIDTSVDTTLEITGQLSNSADTLTLESLFVEIV